jgi:hypothetical protein
MVSGALAGLRCCRASHPSDGKAYKNEKKSAAVFHFAPNEIF